MVLHVLLLLFVVLLFLVLSFFLLVFCCCFVVVFRCFVVVELSVCFVVFVVGDLLWSLFRCWCCLFVLLLVC